MGAARSTRGPRAVAALTTVAIAVAMTFAMFAAPAIASNKTRLVSGLDGGSGSTVGPDGALYVTEGFAGRVSRVDPDTGAVTTFASGLPPSIAGIGGAMDVVFKGSTAYVLVTLVAEDVGGSDVVGIYRIDDPTHHTVIADIGAFALAHPPTTSFFIPTGVQYAIESIRDFFLVTDGHHNRVYRVRLDGRVTERITLGNVVPTGLEVGHGIRYFSQAGPAPHRPEDGRIMAFRPRSRAVTEVARGGRLLVDVEMRAGHLFALAQGRFTPGNPEGSPADPNTGKLLRVDGSGLTPVSWRLDRPTSLEFIDGDGYVVTLTGEIWKINL
jgi:hypothetical protein